MESSVDSSNGRRGHVDVMLHHTELSFWYIQKDSRYEYGLKPESHDKPEERKKACYLASRFIPAGARLVFLARRRHSRRGRVHCRCLYEALPSGHRRRRRKNRGCSHDASCEDGPCGLRDVPSFDLCGVLSSDHTRARDEAGLIRTKDELAGKRHGLGRESDVSRLHVKYRRKAYRFRLVVRHQVPGVVEEEICPVPFL